MINLEENVLLRTIFQEETMKRTLSIIALATLLFPAYSVFAQNKVVVVPLGDGKNNPAPVAKTGSTLCSDAAGMIIPSCTGTGQDGDVQAGAGWPIPRFTDHGDGTITDNLTGLKWTKKLNCSPGNWQTHLETCNALATGTCGLTDSSAAGDWRLANYNELLSLLDMSQFNPALPVGHPFTVGGSSYFISSTTVASSLTAAWEVGFYDGVTGAGLKTGNWEGACVRGGL
jgi:hypothetical protein